MKDVSRTFTDQGTFSDSDSAGRAKLFNILKAYSQMDVEVGYMQGTNFIAGLILLNIQHEESAFLIFTAIMQKDNWRRLYIDETPKLFELVYKVKYFICLKLPDLDKHFLKKSIELEALLASPFFTLFSNLIDLQSANRVMERFLLLGEPYILDVVCNLFQHFRKDMLAMDNWDLQVFIGRSMYQLAIDHKSFFVQHTPANIL